MFGSTRFSCTSIYDHTRTLTYNTWFNKLFGICRISGHHFTYCLNESITWNLAYDHLQEIIQWETEVQIDVHVDPELNTACTTDLTRWCHEYESGMGQSEYPYWNNVRFIWLSKFSDFHVPAVVEGINSIIYNLHSDSYKQTLMCFVLRPKLKNTLFALYRPYFFVLGRSVGKMFFFKQYPLLKGRSGKTTCL